MLRRIIAYVLVALGVVVIALAIASATVWKSSNTVTASLSDAPEAPLVVSEAGVLDMVAEEVTIRATAPKGSPVTLAVGRDADVAAWVDDAPHVLVTGLSSWTHLAAETVDGEGEAPSPAGSDMWVAEASGTGEVTLTWTNEDGRWSLLAATDGTAAAPEVVLTWPQDVRTPYLIPGIVLGALLLVAGLVMLGLRAFERREAARRDASRAERAARGEPVTGEIPAVPGDEARVEAPGEAPEPSSGRAGADGESSGSAGAAPETADASAPTRPLTRRELRAQARAAAAAAEGADGAEVEGGDAENRGAEAAGDADQSVSPEPTGVVGTPDPSPWRRAWGMGDAQRTDATGSTDATRSTDAVQHDAPSDAASEEGEK